jgi:two-component sensor histidine kinase
MQLRADLVVPLAMAFHELATNAVKHGALSELGGRVQVAWELEQARHAVDLNWIESGGPRIAGPPDQRGFGSTLLARGLLHAAGAEISLEYAPEGLRCRMRLPVTAQFHMASI